MMKGVYKYFFLNSEYYKISIMLLPRFELGSLPREGGMIGRATLQERISSEF